MGDRAKPTQKLHPHPPPRRGPGDRTFQPHVLGLAQPSGSLCVLVTRCRTSTVGDAGMAHAGHLGTPPLAAGALGAELLCLRSLTGVWNNPGVPVGVVLGVRGRGAGPRAESSRAPKFCVPGHQAPTRHWAIRQLDRGLLGETAPRDTPQLQLRQRLRLSRTLHRLRGPATDPPPEVLAEGPHPSHLQNGAQSAWLSARLVP